MEIAFSIIAIIVVLLFLFYCFLKYGAKGNEKKEAYETALNAGVCPLCGSPLVLRHGKYGDFYGCSSYPKCKFKSSIKE